MYLGILTKIGHHLFWSHRNERDEACTNMENVIEGCVQLNSFTVKQHNSLHGVMTVLVVQEEPPVTHRQYGFSTNPLTCIAEAVFFPPLCYVLCMFSDMFNSSAMLPSTAHSQ